MIKGKVQQEEAIMIINIYAPNVRAPNYVKQTLLDQKVEIDSNTMIAGDFKTPLFMDRLFRQ
jgi:hypothetical protein